MARDPTVQGDGPDLEAVLDALHDENCRTIIATLTEPMTADAIAEQTGIPLSTTYRKLDLLTEAGLVAEGVELRSDGQHASQYTIAFEEVTLELDDRMELDVTLSHASQGGDERLVELWSTVRNET